jgi:prepilin signal peptidase PulO-like enzyme (type II secretory pathway)
MLFVRISLYIAIAIYAIYESIVDIKIRKTHGNFSLGLAFIVLLVFMLLEKDEILSRITSTTIAYVVLGCSYLGLIKGVGKGDLKFVILLTAFLGGMPTLISLFLASVIALLVILPLLITNIINSKFHIPFIPFLSCGAAIVFFTKELK